MPDRSWAPSVRSHAVGISRQANTIQDANRAQEPGRAVVRERWFDEDLPWRDRNAVDVVGDCFGRLGLVVEGSEARFGRIWDTSSLADQAGLSPARPGGRASRLRCGCSSRSPNGRRPLGVVSRSLFLIRDGVSWLPPRGWAYSARCLVTIPGAVLSDGAMTASAGRLPAFWLSWFVPTANARAASGPGHFRLSGLRSLKRHS